MTNPNTHRTVFCGGYLGPEPDIATRHGISACVIACKNAGFVGQEPPDPDVVLNEYERRYYDITPKECHAPS